MLNNGIQFCTSSTTDELYQILELQSQNFTESISFSEKEKEGFVTVKHDIKLLKRMQTKEPHIMAKYDSKVVGYALSMHPDFEEEIEILKPMFHKIKSLLTGAESFLVMGQICIDKSYRKQGLFKGLYNKMKQEFSSSYNCLITEVASSNQRSLNAHYAVGFKDLLIYEADSVTWHLIKWDW